MRRDSSGSLLLEADPLELIEDHRIAGEYKEEKKALVDARDRGRKAEAALRELAA